MNCWEGTKLEFICSISGTVIRNIWAQIILLAAYTAGVVCFHKYVDGLAMAFQPSLVSVLGTVTGLLLVFRTNTAYDR